MLAGVIKNSGMGSHLELNLVLPLKAGVRHRGFGVTQGASHSGTESFIVNHLVRKSRSLFDHEFNSSIQLLQKFLV